MAVRSVAEPAVNTTAKVSWLVAPPTWAVGLLLLALSLLVRVPYFFPATVNWDESTFILIGQNTLDGHLPITDLWDFKPPFGFYIFAGIIALFGQRLIVIRLAGALCVALVGLLVYLAGHRTWNWLAGLVAASLTVVMVSLMPSGATVVMLEHLALVPMVGALLLLVSRRPSAGILFIAGTLLMAATMIRLNLALTTVLVGAYCMLLPSLQPVTEALRRGVAFALGGLATLALAYLPYLLTGHHAIYWSTMVTGPFLYNNESTVRLSLESHSEVIAGGLIRLPALLVSLLPGIELERAGLHVPLLEAYAGPLLGLLLGATALGMALAVLRWRGTRRKQRHAVGLIGMFLVTTELSVLVTGPFSYHYLIQVIPFMGLFAGLLISQLVASRAWPLVAASGLLTLILAAGPLVGEYRLLAGRRSRGLPLAHGPVYDVVDYLKERGEQQLPIYFMDQQIGYWLLGQKPPSPVVVHPSTIANPGLLQASLVPNPTPEAQLAAVLQQQPAYIVTRPEFWYLQEHPQAVQLLEKTLEIDYELVKVVPGRYDYLTLNVYRRLDLP